MLLEWSVVFLSFLSREELLHPINKGAKTKLKFTTIKAQINKALEKDRLRLRPTTDEGNAIVNLPSFPWLSLSLSLSLSHSLQISPISSSSLDCICMYVCVCGFSSILVILPLSSLFHFSIFLSPPLSPSFSLSLSPS